MARMAPALRRDRRGSPALEFALILPFMVTLLVGLYDASAALVAMRQVTTASQQVAEIATELGVQPNQTSSLTPTQAYQASTAAFAIMPALRAQVGSSAFSVTLSAVVFTATPAGCTTACVMTANTAWSVPLSLGKSVVRPCGVLAQVAPTAAPQLTTLPTAGMTALSSVVVADVSYNFKPMFGRFLGAFTITRSTFLPPRVGTASQYTQYDTANAATDKAVCPGYV